MEVILKQQLNSNYNIEATKIKSYKRLWQVYSDKSRYIIKPFKKTKLIYSLYTLNICMVKKGFKNFPLIHLSNRSLPYFKINGINYAVMSYIDGETADFSRIEDLRKVIDVLTDFHHSCAFYKEQLKLSCYNSIYYRLENRLLKFKGLFNSILIKGSRTTLETKILKLGEELITYSEEALSLIDRGKINGSYQEAYDNQFVAHRDVANHNFIVNKQGWLIDFDIAGIEPQFLDLWQLLNRVMLNTDWDLEQFQRIEEMYNQNKKLRYNERMLIRQLSLFPNDIIREILGVYLYPHKFNHDNAIRILDNFIYKFDSYQTFRKRVSKL